MLGKGGISVLQTSIFFIMFSRKMVLQILKTADISVTYISHIISDTKQVAHEYKMS